MNKQRPKHCPRCNSSKVRVTGTTFYCVKCGFINKEIQIDIRKK